MNWQPILHAVSAFATEHREGLMLFGMAGIVTMRKSLPWPFRKIEPLEWCYEWLRDALLTLLNMKGHAPQPAEPPTDKATIP